jgi:hypothetical protein
MRTGAPENLAMSKSIKHNKKGKPSPKGKRSPNRKNGKIQTLRVPGNSFDTDAERVTLKYTDQYIAVQGASGGAVSSLVYGINTPRVPNRTSGSLAPQGWGSMIAKFSKYVCHGSTFKWRIVQHVPGLGFGSLGSLGVVPTNSSLVQAVCFANPSSNDAVASVRDGAVQKYASPRYEWQVVGNGSQISTVSIETNPRVLWKGSMAMSASKIDGEPNLRSASYEAAVTADPTNGSQYVLLFQDVVADTTFKGVFFVEISMTYDVTFFDRFEQVDSLHVSLPLRAVCMSPPKARVPKEESKAPVAKSSWSLL